MIDYYQRLALRFGKREICLMRMLCQIVGIEFYRQRGKM